MTVRNWQTRHTARDRKRWAWSPAPTNRFSPASTAFVPLSPGVTNSGCARTPSGPLPNNEKRNGGNPACKDLFPQAGRRSRSACMPSSPPQQLRKLGSVDVGPQSTIGEMEVELLKGETILPDAARFFRSRPPNWHNPLAEKDGQPGVWPTSGWKWKARLYDAWPTTGTAPDVRRLAPEGASAKIRSRLISGDPGQRMQRGLCAGLYAARAAAAFAGRGCRSRL